MKKGVFSWYDFTPGSYVLCVDVPDAVAEMLKQKGLYVALATGKEIMDGKPSFFSVNFEEPETLQCSDTRCAEGEFDYVISVKSPECVSDSVRLLTLLRRYLKPEGTLLLGMDNRLGVRYFCGDIDPYTGRAFDGIELYSDVTVDLADGQQGSGASEESVVGQEGQGRVAGQVRSVGGRCYSKDEIRHLLEVAGFRHQSFYSVFPDLDSAQLIYADGFVPNEKLETRYIPGYRNPSGVFLVENRLCDDLAVNGLLHGMANSFLIECRLGNADGQEELEKPLSVTLSLDRGREKAMVTSIYHDRVVKRAAYSEGENALKALYNNDCYLRDRGLCVIDSRLEDGAYITPFIDALSANNYLRGLLIEDRELFIQRMDEFRKLAASSSEQGLMGELGPVLKKGFIDLVPLNCFWTDKGYLIYDQEFMQEDLPLNVILLRTLIIVYDGISDKALVPQSFFFERWGITGEMLPELSRIERKFITGLRNFEELKGYHAGRQISATDIKKNREWIARGRQFYEALEAEAGRMLSLDDVYEEYRDSCFEGMDGRKLYIFGCGRYADKFLAFYRDRFEIARVLDNDRSKWGSAIRGVGIASPECLAEETEDYKVIICVKNWKDIFLQLKGMGIKKIGIYDAHYCYPGLKGRGVSAQPVSGGELFKVGYVSGSFDLFHFGHVELLRRAKDVCSYLIVGVTPDEYIRERKGKEPVIPFEERLAIVGACRYVDEAVGVPFEYLGTVEAYEAYHFDAQICGSDYAGNSWWMEQKAWLEERGSTLYILPYTEQTSTTIIKGRLSK